MDEDLINCKVLEKTRQEIEKQRQQFLNWLMYNGLPTGSIALWYVLYHMQTIAGQCIQPKMETLKIQTGLSENGVKKAREKLVLCGLLEYISNTNNPGIYFLNKTPTSVNDTNDTDTNRKVVDKVASKMSSKIADKVADKLIEIEVTEVQAESCSGNVFGNATKQFGMLTKKK